MNSAERTRSLSLLYEAGYRLSQTLDIDCIFETLYELLAQAMDCDELIVSSYNKEDRLIRCEFYKSWMKEIDTAALPPLPLSEDGSGAQSKVIVTGKAMIIPNYHIFMRGTHPRVYFDENGRIIEEEDVDASILDNRSAIVVPMKLDNEVVGVVQIFSYRFNAYTERDFHIAEAITTQMAVARNNAYLYKRAREELEQRRELQKKLENERALLEQRVAERTESLAQALRVRDQFLANMSHELRTPLASIQGLSELLQYQSGAELSDKQKRYIDLIYQNSDHLIQLVNDVLDMSRIATGEMKLHKEWVPLDSICQACLRYAEGRAMEKNIKVHYVSHTPLERIYCDPQRTKQALNNLLNNAVKFTPEEQSIGFEVMLSADAQAVEFIVWDQGIGINKNDQKRLFQPFSQVDGNLSKQFEGTGLGLVLAKRMIELQEGQIELRSQPNRGTVVVVSLPLMTDAEEDGHGHTQLLTPQQTASLRRMKQEMTSKNIIIADSDQATTELLEYYLEIFNVKPQVVNDGAALKQVLAGTKADVLIIDIFLPGIEITALLNEIRSQKQYAHLPIIATSPIQRNVDGNTLRALSVNDFLQKPFHFSEIAAKIRKYIE